jgi:hypothetical protein
MARAATVAERRTLGVVLRISPGWYSQSRVSSKRANSKLRQAAEKAGQLLLDLVCAPAGTEAVHFPEEGAP